MSRTLIMSVKVGLISVMVLCHSNTFSQLKGFGVRGGFSFSRLNLENANNEKARNGYQIGTFAGYELLKDISLEAGLYYNGKGTTFKIRRRTGIETNFNLNLNYLAMPVTLQYSFLKHFTIGVGLYAAYLLSLNVSRENDDSVDIINIERENLRDTDIGFITGLRFKIEAVSISYHFAQSFSDQRSEQFSSGLFGEIRNTASQITVGFHFVKEKSSN